uniref:Uncharacterized protein n=1 Tax=Ananas comosus var. bracteatus TaxID=296719 RepID=A0A6V7P0U8_ANACO|nr:unnamed protein product [Ananas comosus var. bracteatus]
MMERETRNHYHTRGSTGGVGGGVGGFGSNLNHNHSINGYNVVAPPLGEAELPLQWGNRKRLRCVKVHRKDDSAAAAAAADKLTTVAAAAIRVDRRVVRADKDSANPLLRRPSPPQRRILRNSESTAMRGLRSISSSRATVARATPRRRRRGRGGAAKGGAAAAASSEDKKGSSSGSEGVVWPKFAIALTNKEKEEDFLLFKGSKLPQRPKKRAKLIQRTINLVSPGAWLCDLTLERYEVREKKISKKKPRGLKAMQNMDSDSE